MKGDCVEKKNISLCGAKIKLYRYYKTRWRFSPLLASFLAAYDEYTMPVSSDAFQSWNGMCSFSRTVPQVIVCFTPTREASDSS